MKKSYFAFMLVIALGLVLTACSGSNGNSDKNSSTSANKENQFVTTKTTKEMVDGMLAKIEQPALVEMTGDMVKQMYYIDPALLEEYTIMSPMMNVKTNEVAVFKVKDAKDVAAVEDGIKKRAADVQKQFETYLQDQYENAKNYKLVSKGNYVFFVISDQPDKFVTEFDSYFEKK
ncbi:DUF4358 domain-containing protein [Bacillus sp. FJAT-26390]|uniref:DUF4358 domain-containing protein n=1 Tax=Bacillus sp. FJAT-26390 TaxID=1743142 RepID=UPI000807B09A|nr:DUF4358 domain-containing protein [Bacillus sp. FJAT-26390]OBZ13804.1 hypothetical protein A7975_13460 [Bacillus sp. FJAT-26390]